MSTATAEKLTLKLTRFIKAPRERVFEAWTKPDQIMRWFGPGNSYLYSAKMDVRTGGEYHLHMNTQGCNHGDEPADPEKGRISGVYREVKPFSRLAFTWGWTSNVNREDDTLVTLDFAEVQGGTQLTLTHSGFTDAEACDGHTKGWNGALDKLEHQTDKAVMCMTPGSFSWNELIAADTDKQGAFYTKLFGWEATPSPDMPYTIFKRGNEYIGGMLKCPMEGIPSHWLAYVTVKNVDESLAAAVKLGAKVCVEGKDIPNVGRIAVLMDPNGAAIGIWQAMGM